jgi:acetyl-CoA C-acetyltransferase
MSDIQDAVILSACRTPVGKFLGSLSSVPATELGALAVREAVSRAGVDPGAVTECIMGTVVSAGQGQNPARQAGLGGGLSESIGALTVNKVCGSSLKAASLAAQAVRLGDEDLVVAGGMESMSQAPYLLKGARTGLRMGDSKMIDSMIADGLWDAYNDYHMGNTGEVVAEKYSVSRQEQDEYALASHQKAIAAMDAGKFDEEIVGVEVKGRKGAITMVDKDECPRRESSLEALAKLRPAFKKDGTVTAGNAPPVNDGAAAVVISTEKWANDNGKSPLARIVSYATHGLAPELVMMAPEGAIRKALAKAGWGIGDVDLYEINEAFSVQQCAMAKQLEIPAEKHNANGGAVAIGHPIGASGARCLTTLIYSLKDRGLKKGVVSLCLGGGNAVAMAVEVY